MLPRITVQPIGGERRSSWRDRISLEKVFSRFGWLIVVSAALSLSAWSLYWIARRWGLPIPFAIIVSTAFDGAAMVCASLTLAYAKTHGDSGLGPRLAVLLLAGASAYLNMQHAVIAHDPFAARILFAAPPITAVRFSNALPLRSCTITRWQRLTG